jgi:hypothetical protein
MSLTLGNAAVGVPADLDGAQGIIGYGLEKECQGGEIWVYTRNCPSIRTEKTRRRSPRMTIIGDLSSNKKPLQHLRSARLCLEVHSPTFPRLFRLLFLS